MQDRTIQYSTVQYNNTHIIQNNTSHKITYNTQGKSLYSKLQKNQEHVLNTIKTQKPKVDE